MKKQWRFWNVLSRHLPNFSPTKVVTKSDMSTSQLVLPKNAVEEHIVSFMDEDAKGRLSQAGGRENIWVVDDQMDREYYLTIVGRDHRFSIISWSHVLKSRELKEGQRLKFGWIQEKLHFIVLPDEENNRGEGASNNAEDNVSHGDKRPSPNTADEPAAERPSPNTAEDNVSHGDKRPSQNTADEPAAKKAKQIMSDEASS